LPETGSSPKAQVILYPDFNILAVFMFPSPLLILCNFLFNQEIKYIDIFKPGCSSGSLPPKIFSQIFINTFQKAAGGS
jgi:hypothetical protein